MTQILADFKKDLKKISENPRHPRHPRAISLKL
jgi:hypothetical protein